MSIHDEKSMAQATAGWPGGWYVYENGKVDGPFAADETFKLASESTDGKPRLVSRKGFSQWYALKDLSEIFKMTDQLGRQVQAQGEITEAQLLAARSAIEPSKQSAASSIPSPAPQAVVTPPPPLAAMQARVAPAGGTAIVLKPAVSKRTISTNVRAEGANPVFGGAAVSQPDSEVKVAASIDAEIPTPSGSKSDLLVKTSKSKPLISKAQTKAMIMQEYFLARGRLRLGKLRNPWISAFVGVPLTLGVYWAVWMRDLSREVGMHARNTDKGVLPPAFLAMIPIMHMVMTFKLAKLIVEMEAQNRYRSVTPWVAAMFSIFPPFAMAYLQDAVNRHWLLHVKHAMVKKRSPSE